MGDKAAARHLARELGIPIVAGYDGDDQDDAALARPRNEIGYPILVKPAAGGGGKGMRTVRAPAELRAQLAGARREAVGAFGDERLILERLIEGPRHVEVQVLFDRHGTASTSASATARSSGATRRCSRRRRRRPSTRDPAAADRGGARDRGAVGYESAGTCEFLLDDRGEIFFLEMNTRLQVEHPVTELVTGRDLVAEQLRIAGGRAARARPGDDRRGPHGGHAIEVRLYAEDAEAGFLPATGRIERLALAGRRRDPRRPGIEAGDGRRLRFDPMLAKVIAHGADRDRGAARA